MKQLLWLIAIILVQVAFCQRPERRFQRTRMGQRQPPTAPKLKCVDYGAFRDRSWVCEDKIQCPDYYDAEEINYQIRGGTQKQYNGKCYSSDIKDCIMFANKTVLEKRPENADRKVEFEDLCKMRIINVTNVYLFKQIFPSPELCVVVNTDWLYQSLYFAKCTNPRNPNHDMCQMDYSYRNEYRCVQSGFVWRTIWTYCPRINEYHPTDVLVPTTCSCRKCAHCETSHQLIDEFMRSFNLNRGGTGPKVKNPSQLRPKPEKCILPGQQRGFQG